MTPYDFKSFGRALWMGAVLGVLVLVAMAATDEAGSMGGARAARLAAVAPLAGAVGSALANGQAQLRGEIRCLMALGASPWRAFAGALVAGTVIGVTGAVVLSVDAMPLEGLFPQAQGAIWIRTAVDAWHAPSLGVRLGPGAQDLALLAPTAAAGQPAPSRTAVVCSIAALSCVLGPWLELRLRWRERLGAGGVLALSAVVGFHLVAAGQASAWWLMTVPTVAGGHVFARRTTVGASRDAASAAHP